MARRVSTSREEYEQLCRMIQRWNENRVEIFEISMPNEVRQCETKTVGSLYVITLSLHHVRLWFMSTMMSKLTMGELGFV